VSAPRPPVEAGEHGLLRDPAFLRYGQAFTATNSSRYAFALAGCIVLWWPLDLVLYDDPRVLVAMSLFRVAALAIIVGVYFIPAIRRRLAQQTATSNSLWMCAGLTLSALAVGQAGSIEDGWAHFFALGVTAAVAAVVSLPRRILLTGMIVSAGLVGFFIARPEDLSSPAIPGLALFFVLSWAITVLTGHGLTRELAVHFSQERALDEQRAELNRLSEGLEGLVTEQTAELRALARTLQETRDRERLWMASEMHDGLGQQVASLGYALAYIDRIGPDSEAGRAVVGECEALLDGMDSTIAVVLEQLQPAVLGRGLQRSLERLVGSLNITSPVDFSLHSDVVSDVVSDLDAEAEAGVSLHPDVALAAFRVVQEGTSNALKHARASEVQVRVAMVDGELRLEVQDDGVGFLPSEQRGQGFGLAGVRSRVEKLGGQVLWRPNGQSGTVLIARLPAHPEAPSGLAKPRLQDPGLPASAAPATAGSQLPEAEPTRSERPMDT
jgi:signal transduction histidine kinase